MKKPKIKEVQEDPAVKAQRLAAEKAAQDEANANVSGLLSRKTRMTARVFGGPSLSAVAASTKAKGVAPVLTPAEAAIEAIKKGGFGRFPF